MFATSPSPSLSNYLKAKTFLTTLVQICRPFLVSLDDDDVNGSSSLGEVHKSANYVGSCTQRSSRMDWMGPLGQGETIGDCTREREREIGGQK